MSVGVLMALAGSSQAVGQAPQSREAATTPRSRGYVLAHFTFAAYDSDEKIDCPEGFTLSPIDSYMALLPPDERAKMDRPDDLGRQLAVLLGVKNPKDFPDPTKDPKGYQRLVSHSNCSNPQEFPAYSGYKTITHRGIALGLDLDGRTDSKDGQAMPGTCAHNDFTGPNGERGIDNQMWRVLGCVKAMRHEGAFLGLDNSHIRQGGPNVLLEIADIDDEKNDPEVTVGLYQGSDPVSLTTTGEVLPGASLHVNEDPKYRARLKGRIENGILWTEPGNITLKRKGLTSAPPTDITLKSGRLKLELLPDGTAKGLMAGYYNVDQFYRAVIGNKGIAASQSYGYTCPGVLDQMRKLADGDRDPATGTCRAISMAWDINAVPAFIIHSEAAATKMSGASIRPTHTGSRRDD